MSYPYYNYGYDYGYYYGGQLATLGVAVIVAVILGCVLYFAFMNKKNEGKFTGIKEKIYNFLTFNKFYLEEIAKFLYVIGVSIVTVVGVVIMFISSLLSGLVIVLVGNVALRVSYELLMMFIILCKKSAAIDKKLAKIEKFYGDDFDEEPGDERGDSCAGCDSVDCSGCGFGEEDEDCEFEFFEGCEKGSCEGCASYGSCEKKPE